MVVPPVRLCLLALLLRSAAGAAQTGIAKKASGQPGAQSNRLIVRFADPAGARADGELLEQKVKELRASAGVWHAKAYSHVGMAVADCESFEAVERLVQELEEDPLVELVTPDTVVNLFDAGSSPRPDDRALSESPMEEARQCSAQPRCKALALAGRCCPASDGLMLDCCEPSKGNIVAFRSSLGRYMTAEDNGAANINREKMDEWEKFRLYENDDGTISLLGHFGKYLTAQEGGAVNTNSRLIGRHQKFRLVRNNDSTVSLKTTGLPGTYIQADSNGHLSANSLAIGTSEKFQMIRVKVDIQLVPNDANFSALWGMDDPIHDKDIDAPEAWKAFHGSTGEGIVVAVIDTGIDYTHEDLRDAMWTNPREIPNNGLDDDGNGYIDDVHGVDFANEDGDPMDDQLHGTHCAGTIAGVGDNGKGVAGVSWRGVQLMALKFLTSTGSGRTSDAVKAIDYAVAHGAKIASNSWGGSSSSAALRIAIERAEASGVLFVAAAGNSATNNDEEPQYPANYASANVISVASINPLGDLSRFSCYGATRVDVAAPGSGIYSTIPKNGYKFLSGTSMATPHVSGLAALVWMYRPQLSMAQVKDIILQSVVRAESLEGKLLTGGRINARRALEAAAVVEPPRPPKHAPRGVSFRDEDPKVGVISGVVTVTAADDESDVTYYKVYFVSRAGFQLSSIGNVTATGEKLLRLHFGPLALQDNVGGIVAVAGNATGELPAELDRGVPSAKIEDFGLPELGPSAATWKGDADSRPGFVAGRLAVQRAMDERTITSYNVYWSNSSTSRGPLVGTIPAIGFHGPRCTGPSCPLINMTEIAGGFRMERSNYTDHEMAVVAASGPGVVRITRFDTEAFFDILKVGRETLYGKPALPKEIPFPDGMLSVHWYSDESTTGTGWSFELRQTNSVTELELPASRPLGRGLLVVPTYMKSELPQGLFVEVPDYAKGMPPSPAFAPLSVTFADNDTAAGIIAGTADVLPAPGAATNGSVTYYQLDIADASGKLIGHSWRVNASGSSPLHVPIAARALPQGASEFVVRAGNNFGLGEGRASVALVDSTEAHSRTPVASAALELQAAHAVDLGGDDLETAEAEPWLRPPGVREEKTLVWHSNALSLLASVTPGSRVFGSVLVQGLAAKAAATPASRLAFERTVAQALQKTVHVNVDATRVFEARGGAEVEFKVELSSAAPASALDRVEAHVILLSRGGGSARRFEQNLFAALAAAGVRLPEAARASVAGPRQVNPRRDGRRLAAADAPRRLESSQGSEASAGARAAAGWTASALFALLPALGIVAGLVAARRRSSRGQPQYVQDLESMMEVAVPLPRSSE